MTFAATEALSSTTAFFASFASAAAVKPNKRLAAGYEPIERPPLSLATLRARGEMTEVRIPELRFSRRETRAFLDQMMGKCVDDTVAAVLEEKTEGWVTGLRLAALSMRNRSDLDRILTHLPDDNSSVMDYIINLGQHSG
jgi:hypothetical protein